MSNQFHLHQSRFFLSYFCSPCIYAYSMRSQVMFLSTYSPVCVSACLWFSDHKLPIANRKLCLMTVFSSSVSVVSLNELYECAIFKVAKQGTLCKLMFNILHTYTLKYVVQYTLDRTAHTYRQKKERKRCSYAGIIFNTKAVETVNSLIICLICR